MTYISWQFYVLVGILLVFYYSVPLKARWKILLVGSVAFYLIACPKYWIWVLLTTISSFYLAKSLEFNKKKKLFVLSLVLTALPWVILKPFDMIFSRISNGVTLSVFASVGISFYTIQIISYLVDVYTGKCLAEKNLLKYGLFVLYFPQIIQGPIPRYTDLNKQLFEGHNFEESLFMRGVYNVFWGFFLKLVIADKAAIFVNQVFDNIALYSGGYYLIAGILYSIELYADFSGCFYISNGVSKMFGIQLASNFRQPYFAISIKDFWNRWHISLSSWLRDYIYIPLGGNRKGSFQKRINILVTFLVSGIWHGQGIRFVVWGMTHAIYEILGDANKKIRVKSVFLCRIFVFFIVTMAWILFRANSLYDGLYMIWGIIRHPSLGFRPEGDTLLLMANSEWVVLLFAIVVMLVIDILREKKVDLSGIVLDWCLPARWIFYVAVIFGIMSLGTYGLSYDSSAFIYGGF